MLDRFCPLPLSIAVAATAFIHSTNSAVAAVADLSFRSCAIERAAHSALNLVRIEGETSNASPQNGADHVRKTSSYQAHFFRRCYFALVRSLFFSTFVSCIPNNLDLETIAFNKTKSNRHKK